MGRPAGRKTARRTWLGVLLTAAGLVWLSGTAAASPPEAELEPPAAGASVSAAPTPAAPEADAPPPTPPDERRDQSLRLASDATLPLVGAVAALAVAILLLRWWRRKRHQNGE